jgi:Tfp pilus assembly protein PilF
MEQSYMETQLQKAREYFERGYHLQMSGRLREAIKLYRHSIAMCETAEAYTFLGWAYSQQENYEGAIEQCQHAIQIDPDFGNPYNDIGAYMIQLGKYDEAVTWLELALNAKRYDSPHFPHFNLGRIYERKGMWDEAMGEYENALEIDPNYKLAQDAIIRLQAMMN